MVSFAYAGSIVFSVELSVYVLSCIPVQAAEVADCIVYTCSW